MENVDAGAVASIVSGIVSALGALVSIYVVIYKLRPEARKTESESDSAIAEASESLATSTKTSIEYWRVQLSEHRDQINELKEKLRLINDQQIVTQRLVEEQRRELIAWQDWARRLAHQVVSLGGVPVKFKPETLDKYLDNNIEP
jgi:5-bromo-4-chloroindolyl phosphate hydrolysis protein